MVSYAQPLSEFGDDVQGVNRPAIDPVQTPQAKQETAKTPSFMEWLGSPEAMALASGLLKASGPSQVPISMGQAMGMGMEEMLKAKLQFGNQQLDKDKFAYTKSSDQRDYNLRKEDHDVTRDFRKAQIADIMLKQKRAQNLEDMITGRVADPLTAADPNLKAATPNPTPGLLNKPQAIDQAQSPQPGLLNQPTNLAPTAQGGVFANLPPEKKTMALLMLNSGHADKIPEMILGKPEEPYTLSEGQVRFDKNNKQIAYGKPKDILTPLEKQVMAEGLTPGTQPYQQRIAELNSGKELYTPYIKETIAEGFKPGTPEFASRLKDRANRANIQQQFKIPPGYAPVNPSDLSAGLIRVPGGPAEEVSSQDAGRIQMIRTAQKDIGASRGDVEGLLFNKNPDGTPNYSSPNRTNIAAANATGIPFLESVPFSKGRDMRTAIEQGIQAITRIETGAAMPQSEIENTMTRYMPRSGDSDKTILQKWNRFKDFIGNANKLMDPSQRFEGDRFKSDLSNEQSINEQLGNKPGSQKQRASKASSMSDDQLKQFLGIK